MSNKCWCGVENPYFSDEIDDRCGGLGVLFCECGGDSLCVCHWHGEVSCFGCEDCEDNDGPDYDDEDEFARNFEETA